MRFIKLFTGRCCKGILQESKRGLRMHSRLGPSAEEVSLVRQDLHGNLPKEKIFQRQKFPIPAVNNPAVTRKRSAIFSEEQQKQRDEIGRIEKIEVKIEGEADPEKESIFLMNKAISTPFHVAKHLSELHVSRSIAAEVNGNLWDIHKPLLENCSLKFLHMKMKDDDPFQVNRVFWRSCSMMLGYIAERAFQDHLYIELHSFPSPNVRSGSFVYDVDIKLKDWKPNSDEMRVFSAEFRKLTQKNLEFERLEVSKDVALKMFDDNRYKREQIPVIASTSAGGNTVTVYRIGDFVDISKGPMMASTNQVGRATATALIPLESSVSPTLYRFQGVALPANFLLNHFAWSLIESRGKQLNTARIPGNLESPQGTGSSEQQKQAALA